MQSVLLERMVKTMQEEINEIELAMLDEDIIHLHSIARHVEQTIGVGALSEDIRRSADRLRELLKRA